MHCKLRVPRLARAHAAAGPAYRAARSHLRVCPSSSCSACQRGTNVGAAVVHQACPQSLPHHPCDMQYGANIVPVPEDEKQDYTFPRDKGLQAGASVCAAFLSSSFLCALFVRGDACRLRVVTPPPAAN